jgi:hypothetical protein
MVDYDFYTQQAKMLNLKMDDLTGDCYYIETVKPETETLRYNVLTKTVTMWPIVYYCNIGKEIRTATENIIISTNEELEEQCTQIQINLKKIKMELRLSKMKKDF